jgi:hypothetical protein
MTAGPIDLSAVLFFDFFLSIYAISADISAARRLLDRGAIIRPSYPS